MFSFLKSNRHSFTMEENEATVLYPLIRKIGDVAGKVVRQRKAGTTKEQVCVLYSSKEQDDREDRKGPQD